MKCPECKGSGQVWFKNPLIPPPEPEEAFVLHALGCKTRFLSSKTCLTCRGRGKVKALART